MTVIYGTNMVVDDFRILTQYPLQKFIFFLTHMHAGLLTQKTFFSHFFSSKDHYYGMKNHWNYGPIYCSYITKILLLNKFQVETPVVTPKPTNKLT